MKLTDERIKDIESWAHKLTPLSAPILGEQIGSMAQELLLLRAEVRAARKAMDSRSLASQDNTTAKMLNWGSRQQEYDKARKASEEAGF